MLRRCVLTLAIAIGVATPALSQTTDVARWEDDIRVFEAADRARRPPDGGIVFIGSSSIRLWSTLAEDFPGKPVINRGFGGSQLPEVLAFVPRIVLPYRPRQVVVYCGGNDIHNGRTAQQVLTDYQALVRAIHAELPKTGIAFISIAGNPARWSQIETVRAANRLVAAWSTSDPRLDFIDVHHAMLSPDGLPRPDIFTDDRLHMNEKGYRIWREVVGKHLN